MEGKLISTTTKIRYELKGNRLEERSAELSELIKKKIQLENEKAAYSKAKGIEIKSVQKDIEKVGGDVGNGFELIDVACKKRKNFVRGIWEYIDSQTGEIIKTKPLVDDDLQTSIEDYEEE